MMAGFDIRWQVEIDDYCRKILNLRFPEAKKYDDIKKFKGNEVEPVDIVVGGFPCQPFSVAGKQRGTADDRNLWPQMLRVVKEVRPAWVVCENVSGIIPIYLDTVLADLEAAGYATRTFVFPAHAFGANHRRERIWIVGHTRLLGQADYEKQATGIEQSGEDILYATAQGLQEPRQARERKLQEESCRRLDNRPSFRSWWKIEPPVGRVVDGCPRRVDRLKCLGNGQVSVCTYFIGQTIMEFERLNAHKLPPVPQNLYPHPIE